MARVKVVSKRNYIQIENCIFPEMSLEDALLKASEPLVQKPPFGLHCDLCYV